MTNRKTTKPFILASNLVFIAFVLSILYQLLPNITVMAGMLWLVVVSKLLILGLAILLRLGYSWSKYLLALVSLLSLLGIHDVLDVFSYPRWSAMITIAQIVLVVCAAAVVFRKNKPS